MVFAQKLLDPGPGTRPMATLRGSRNHPDLFAMLYAPRSLLILTRAMDP
jgi:hypothetical protein